MDASGMSTLITTLSSYERGETTADLRRRLDAVVNESAELVAALEAEQQTSAERYDQLVRESNLVSDVLANATPRDVCSKRHQLFCHVVNRELVMLSAVPARHMHCCHNHDATYCSCVCVCVCVCVPTLRHA
jgi:hypothetical protein